MTLYHPLRDPSRDGATAEQNLEWMEKIRASEGEQRLALINEMVEANIPWVFLKLETFIHLYPGFEYMWDDMVSEGLLALTESLHILADKEKPQEDENNPQGYAGVVIVRRVGRMLERETSALPEDYKSPLDVIIDPRDIVETRDMLMASCETKFHRDILAMRERGSSFEEIAQAFDMSRGGLSVYFYEIKNKFEQLQKEML